MTYFSGVLTQLMMALRAPDTVPKD